MFVSGVTSCCDFISDYGFALGVYINDYLFFFYLIFGFLTFASFKSIITMCTYTRSMFTTDLSSAWKKDACNK